MKRLLLVVPLLVLAAAPARAENAQQVAQALKATPVYQSSGLDLLDVGQLVPELQGSDPQVYVAALPASAAATSDEARLRATDIGNALGDTNGVVLVITANHHVGDAAGQRAKNRGVDAKAVLDSQVSSLNGKPFDKAHLDAFVLAFVQAVEKQASASVSGVTYGPGPVSTGGGGGTGWLVGGTVVVLLALVVGAVAVSRGRRLDSDMGDEDALSILGSGEPRPGG